MSGLDGETSAPLLEVRDLHTRFDTRRGTVHAVNGVSFHLREGESLALVGESGSGKSVSALSVLGLVPPPGRIVSGEIRLRGEALTGLTPSQWSRIRGRHVAMIFQDPMTSLNPVLPVGRQIEEVLRQHLKMDRKAARTEAVSLLNRVGIPDAERRRRDAPHTFSGGQRQRIMIAMALACRPQVLIADEPTTALDVTVQAQIVALVRELQEELGMGVLWITHDLALVAGLVDRVAVLYAGTVVEEASVEALFQNPRHPYTRGLMRALPAFEHGIGDEPPHGDRPRLDPVEGQPPVLTHEPTSCPFAPRCDLATDRCRHERPPLESVGGETGPPLVHRAACWHQDTLS
jgi:oligopeptide transport system ATP-binding protein